MSCYLVQQLHPIWGHALSCHALRPCITRGKLCDELLWDSVTTGYSKTRDCKGISQGCNLVLFDSSTPSQWFTLIYKRHRVLAYLYIDKGESLGVNGNHYSNYLIIMFFNKINRIDHSHTEPAYLLRPSEDAPLGVFTYRNYGPNPLIVWSARVKQGLLAVLPICHSPNLPMVWELGTSCAGRDSLQNFHQSR